jgi:hypothetical protein
LRFLPATLCGKAVPVAGHPKGDVVFQHACKMGLEGIVSSLLCRDVDEVRKKAKELGLEEHPGKRRAFAKASPKL